MSTKILFRVNLCGVPQSTTESTANNVFRRLIYRFRSGEDNPTEGDWSLQPIYADTKEKTTWFEARAEQNKAN